MIKILTEAELRASVFLDLDAIDRIEQAFARLAGGGVMMPRSCLSRSRTTTARSM